MLYSGVKMHWMRLTLFWFVNSPSLRYSVKLLLIVTFMLNSVIP